MKNPYKKIQNFKKIHFIGIGGSGMYGIAEVLLNLGCSITGSDINSSQITKRLESLGVKIYKSHKASNLKDTDLVIYSNAISKNNEELSYALNKSITTIPRAEMLAELMRFKYGVAVAGSHGKSTTTSLISWILSECNLDPTYIIGGKLKTSSSHGRLGDGQYLVAEADESDSSFLCLSPKINIVTNIDNEHLDNYKNNIRYLKNAYISFINNIPFYERTFLNGDDKNIKSIMSKIKRPIITFGLTSINNYYATNIFQNKSGMTFTLNSPSGKILIKTKLHGEHNILNILVSFAISEYLELPSKKIVNAIMKFEGISRRFEVHDNFNSKFGPLTLINDYGHHPTEIYYTLKTIKKIWEGRNICMIFQPHRYSRTKDCLKEFIKVFKGVDKLIVTETYSGGESKTKYTSNYLCKKLISENIKCYYVKNLNSIPNKIKSIFDGSDIFVIQGAGNISQLIKIL